MLLAHVSIKTEEESSNVLPGKAKTILKNMPGKNDAILFGLTSDCLFYSAFLK
jgi:hypothetical protein